MLKALLRSVLAVGLAACAGAAPIPRAAAVEAGNAALGHVYAEQACASCHAIQAGETRSPHPAAAPFDRVANTPGMTRTALNAWLHTPHPSMPNFIVDPDRIDDLSAYLFTLKRAR